MAVINSFDRWSEIPAEFTMGLQCTVATLHPVSKCFLGLAIDQDTKAIAFSLSMFVNLAHVRCVPSFLHVSAALGNNPCQEAASNVN